MEINFDVRQSEQVLSPWATLVTRRVQVPGGVAPQEFHSFKLADYVAMLAVTTEGQIPLVRQYRPALGRVTLELPSGLLDSGEEPAEAAARELQEETGLRAGATVTALGCLVPDSGRLENRLWGFFTDNVSPKPAFGWEAEPELEHIMVSPRELQNLILTGQLDHALHIAVIGLALTRGCLAFPSASATPNLTDFNTI